MTQEEVVPPQNEGVELAQEMQQDHAIEVAQETSVDTPKDDHVPLSKFIKERKKRQEIEQQLLQYKSRQEPVDDSAQYESATKADLGHTQNEIIRTIEERQWIKNNPEKYEKLNLHLQDFLEKKPYLAVALKQAPNRWEEAYELMEALSPQEKRQLQKQEPVRKTAPNSPGSVPKSAGINEVVDFMSMSDAEYRAYVNSKRKR